MRAPTISSKSKRRPQREETHLLGQVNQQVDVGARRLRATSDAAEHAHATDPVGRGNGRDAVSVLPHPAAEWTGQPSRFGSYQRGVEHVATGTQETQEHRE